jgi:phage terminase large subunit
MIWNPADIKSILSTHTRPTTTEKTIYPYYEPNSPQAEGFHEAKEKVKLLLGGNRSGKTFTVTADNLKDIRKIPGGVIWAATVHFDGVGQYLWPTYQELLAPEEIKEISWLSYGRQIPNIVRCEGFTIFFKSYEQGRRKFQGGQVDIIHLDEECDHDIYIECLARTIDRRGKIRFSMSPLMGKTWVYKDLFIRKDELDFLYVDTISLFDNKFIDDAEKQVMLEAYGEDEIARRVNGEFTVLEGAVFKELRPKKHFVDWFPVPDSWRFVGGIDLGYVNPFCYLMGVLDPDGRLFLIAEHYQSETLLKDHAQVIQQMERNANMVEGHNMTGIPENRVCDHDRQERAELDEYGIWTSPAIKDVNLSLEVINRLLKDDRIFVMSSCPHLQEEMENYRYKTVRAGTEDKEQPIKENDHAVDAFRYIVMYFFEGYTNYEVET